ncbi:uncharacterized protein GIQ15_06548 [Arthroderma uncinatum]|uniref:uncharacterized protein n=1 Tax=Arthroderma uncinatum TaxID=74035 RepID=UPI00144ADA4D|nr:uncharacterized protein GIQ15_06548 [Arthroderma uncinatum]KAF3479572.1 hypothetical protein GIQ15_06548 [Arthroderma uncinatum]
MHLARQRESGITLLHEIDLIVSERLLSMSLYNHEIQGWVVSGGGLGVLIDEAHEGNPMVGEGHRRDRLLLPNALVKRPLMVQLPHPDVLLLPRRRGRAATTRMLQATVRLPGCHGRNMIADIHMEMRPVFLKEVGGPLVGLPPPLEGRRPTFNYNRHVRMSHQGPMKMTMIGTKAHQLDRQQALALRAALRFKDKVRMLRPAEYPLP